jgi:hypothetical protein
MLKAQSLSVTRDLCPHRSLFQLPTRFSPVEDHPIATGYKELKTGKNQ